MNFASGFTYVYNSDSDSEADDLAVQEDELAQESVSAALPRISAPSSNSVAAAPAGPAPPPPVPASTASAVKGFFSSLLSSSSSSSASPAPASEAKRERQEQRSKRAGYRRKADTNVVSLQFASLVKNVQEEVFAGDPTHCENPQCKAVLGCTSKITTRAKKPAAIPNPPVQDQKSDDAPLVAPSVPSISSASDVPLSISSDSLPLQVLVQNVDEQETVWCCEYCGNENLVNLAPEEIPTTEAREYLIEPASENKHIPEASGGAVIFVVDISGSMCVTSEVPGKFKLKGSASKSSSAFDLPAEAGFVNAPVRSSNRTTHVTRLQCLQAAIDKQIEDWRKNQPQRRVGLVTFNREVSIFGDGTITPEIVTGDKLSNQAALQEIGSRMDIAKPVSEAGEGLCKKLWDLEEGGATALGPAMLVAVSMASKMAASRVVLCTDGLANVGLGALDKASCPTDADREKVEQWYESVGHLAKLSGVTVSVISIKGEECSLEDLSKIADITGGDVTRVDPLELERNFNDLLAKPIIATQVSATILMHNGLVFRGEDVPSNKMVREVGNVNEDTELTFEYGVRNEQLQSFAKLESLPFQVQVVFTKLDGMKCLRVISKSQIITRNRQQAEEDLHMDILAANAQRQSAKLQERGDVLNARVNNLAWGKFMGRHSQRSEENSNMYAQWMQEADSHQTSMSVQQSRQQLQAPSAAPAGSNSAVRSAKAVRGDSDFEHMHKAKVSSSAIYRKIGKK